MEFVVNENLWKIEFVNEFSEFLHRSDGTQSVGATDNNLKTIFLSENLQGEFLRKVICHELTHVFMFEYGILINLEAEEFVCDFVATYGTDIITMTDFVFDLIRRVKE